MVTNGVIPTGAVHSQALVNVEGHWLTEIKEEGFEENTDLKGFIELINKTAAKQHPIHVCRMDFITIHQTGSPLDLARELAAGVVTAEWDSWARKPPFCTFLWQK